MYVFHDLLDQFDFAKRNFSNHCMLKTYLDYLALDLRTMDIQTQAPEDKNWNGPHLESRSLLNDKKISF